MIKRSIFFILFSFLLQFSVAFAGGTCSDLFSETKEDARVFLNDISKEQSIYRRDLYNNGKMDPQFLHNFARKTDNYYSISEVVQHYPITQARESVENVLERLEYIQDHWADFKIPRKYKKYFPKEKFEQLIEKGKNLLKENKWPFFETIDFIDQGLMYGEIRSPKEVEDPFFELSYIKTRERDNRIHGQSDPALIYMYQTDHPGRAFYYMPHPALLRPVFVQNRLFEFREFNWAMTKGAFLISVGPQKDLEAHDITSSYWTFYHDVSGHFKSVAISRTVPLLESIYRKKGLQKIDKKNGNQKEAIHLLRAYIEMREDFLNKLLSAGERDLAPEDQNAFHEAVFNYIHENLGGVLEPQRMRYSFAAHGKKNTVTAFILKTLDKYIASHDLELFR